MLHTYTPTNKFAALAKSALPAPAVRFLRTLRDPKEIVAAAHLASDRSLDLPLAKRLRLVACTQWAQWRGPCGHTQHKGLPRIAPMFGPPGRPAGVVVGGGWVTGGGGAGGGVVGRMGGG